MYTHNLAVCNYGSDFRCLLMCCIFFSFLFLFIFHVKNLPQGYCLLLSFAICCENAAKR